MRLSTDAYRRIAVVADDLCRPLLPFHPSERGQWHHAAANIAHIKVEQIVGLHALPVSGLNRDALHAARIREIIHVAGAEIG